MTPVRTDIAYLKKAIAQGKGFETRLELCATTPSRKRHAVEIGRIVRALQEELRGLKYVAEQERLSQQRQAALQ